MSELIFEINIHVDNEDDLPAATLRGHAYMQRLRALSGVDTRHGFLVRPAQIDSPEGSIHWNILTAELRYIGSFVDLVAAIHQVAHEFNQEVIPIYIPSHNKGVMVGPGNSRWPLFDLNKFVRPISGHRQL